TTATPQTSCPSLHDALPILQIVRAGGHGLCRHDPGERHAHLQRAVLVEDPVETVIVVSGFRYEREDQFARAPRLGAMLPGDAPRSEERRVGKEWSRRRSVDR